MRVVALEEHFTVPALVARIDRDAISARGFRPRNVPKTGPNPVDLMPEIGHADGVGEAEVSGPDDGNPRQLVPPPPEVLLTILAYRPG